MKKSEQDLISRAVRDADFRGRLLADPNQVIESEGYAVGSEMLERIKGAGSLEPQAIEAAIATAMREGGVGG
ncbi:MAG: hypothetical protein IT372_25040 [Polyangiaceae bacterium]|nr:hypothetical protein [Polyangiaceae bacterium]